jgi:hypothetical protein
VLARRIVAWVKDAQRPPPPWGSRDVGELSWDEGERLSEEQQQLHPSIDRITAWGEQHPDVFAGVWLDNSRFLEGSGPVRVAMGYANADVDHVMAMVGSLADDPTKLVLVHKQLPESVLRRAQERVVAEHMQGVGSERAYVSACGVDLDANVLEVMLSRPDEELETHIRQEHPGIPVHVTYGVFTSLGASTGVERRAG